MAQLAAEARTPCERAVQEQRAGDCAKDGEELRAIGDGLRPQESGLSEV